MLGCATLVYDGNGVDFFDLTDPSSARNSSKSSSAARSENERNGNGKRKPESESGDKAVKSGKKGGSANSKEKRKATVRAAASSAGARTLLMDTSIECSICHGKNQVFFVC